MGLYAGKMIYENAQQPHFPYSYPAMSKITKSQIFFCQACGKGAGCFCWPPKCKFLNCTVTIRFVYHKSVSSMTIDISAVVDGWVAFGLNENPAVMVSFIKGMKFQSLCTQTC